MSRRLPTLAQHVAELAACRRCAHAPAIRPIVSHAARPRIVLVGQAPGKVEAEGGKAFAGRAGRTLFRWLERAGIDEERARRTIYIAAVTRCYPGPHPSGRGDRVPSQSEQARCADWLERELAIIRPAVVIPVGKLAIARFLPPVALDELIGREHRVAVGDATVRVIPLPHPSGASSWIYQGDHPRLLERALDLIGAALRREGIVSRGGRHTRSVA